LADRALVDADDVVDRVGAGERVELADGLAEMLLGAMLAMEAGLEGAQQHVMYECALTRTGNPGHRRHGAERNLDVDAFEVVLARAGERDPPRPEAPALRRHRDLFPPREIGSG